MNTLDPWTEKAPDAIDPTSHADDRQACGEALLEEFAVLWLGHSRSKTAWQEADWAFEELCNRVLLFLDPGDGPLT